MAFVAASDTILARDLWPQGCGRLTNDTVDMNNLPVRRVVPTAFEDLLAWLCVDADSGNSASVWLHPDVADGQRRPVVVRLQGIVQDTCLRALGDWNGQADGAPRAMQRLTLTGSHFPDAFLPQLHAVENIRDTVLHLLGRPGVERTRQGSDIVLKRRVFTRVNAGHTAGQNVTLSASEDPSGRAARLRQLWKIDRRVAASLQESGGVLRKADPLAIKVGDLVDVAVSVQAVTIRTRAGRRTDVMFVPLHVVRLKTAREMQVWMTDFVPTTIMRPVSNRSLFWTACRRRSV
ncbi:hypothetical protein OH76DRAFT_1459637 [Lentinus brumalis]|uniref:Uncharacterized protein n=1 Tax=Lentinus brumalis TaxID=2498619 RepID=A0A371CHS7_9APHY|nr:hypothetical protein OH76DRAFT_1459637 [Polyporus brumalis]